MKISQQLQINESGKLINLVQKGDPNKLKSFLVQISTYSLLGLKIT
jgi:hypothetical protein